MEVLKAKFNEVATVVDLFCPKKCDKEGKSFGFMRFPVEETRNMEKLMKKLNNVWIDSYKVRVYKPRFKCNHRKVENQKQVTFAPGYGVRTPNKSCKEVVAKEQRVEKKEESNIREKKNTRQDCEFSFVTSTGDKEWLSKCYVALLISGFS
ncbi:hypothetical protein ACS0TY_020824 [Phlomoides rotata]